MTSKIKQSIAVQRQFPDHIRENYPVFVEFVKLYYDYLQETQSQNLESIKDVDNTLDEFIDKFKNELAKNFPVELSSDKRLLLKHLREFYLSRGSEASFKFLFRTLFGRDNVDIYYPSTQMLRVSDGKWQQDVSIFVTPNGVKPDVTTIVGKTILITNSKGKVIRTFVNRIQPYSDNICEVFIQRDYINEIAVGDIASCEDTGLTATVLPCPSKVSIYKAGKGFKVGELYALRTQIGRGCVIKITKTGSEGDIKAIQVVKFGLDYKTKFYSYLSSKDLLATEYNHPLTLNWGGPGLPAPYNENSGGFIDYGWGSKQTYFYYDDTIPVATPDHASDRFFANPDYVGEVVQQFYTNASENPIDEDLAIIEIDLGAVARYPGYYLKSDGFISDEIYIQDGKYYQAFSYVIKVEEELRKYADIVKALVHPAGMKMYGEYNIFNNLEVSATMPKLFSILQLPLLDHPPSIANTDDRGYGYTSYNTELINGQIITTPADGANKVYAAQGKASLLIEKITSEIIENLSDSVYSKIVEKQLSEFIENEDLNIKEYFKNVSEIISNVETLNSSYDKNIKDEYDAIEYISKSVEKITEETLSLLELAYKEYVKNNYESIDSPTDIFNKELLKTVYESIVNQENISSLYEKYLAESLLPQDQSSKQSFKYPEESIDSPTDSYVNNLDKISAETLNSIEVFSNEIDKILNDQSVLQEVSSLNPIKITQEIISIVGESISNIFEKPLSDNTVLTDTIINSVERFRTFSDTISNIQDACQILKVFLIEDILNLVTTEVINFQTLKSNYENIIPQDIISNFLSRIVEDSLSSFVDQFSNSLIKNIVDAQGTLDSKSISTEKNIDEFTRPVIDSSSNVLQKVLSEDSLSFSENLNSIFAKTISDIQVAAESLYISYEKPTSDLINSPLDSAFNDFGKNNSEQLNSPLDSAFNDFGKNSDSYLDVRDFIETLQFIITNSLLNRASISNYDVFQLASTSSINQTKTFVDAINNSTNGRIILSPYGSELYFDPIGDYQPATNIT